VATVKGKWPYYDVMTCWDYYLQHSTTTRNFPETATATEVSITEPDETEMGNSEQVLFVFLALQPIVVVF
jgi:hypothetical protein